MNRDESSINQNISLAEKLHEQNWEFIKNSNEASISSGFGVLKSLLLINGGAAVALIALAGSSFSGEVGSKYIDAARFFDSLMWFGLGVASAVLGSAFAYFINYFYTAAASKRNLSYDYPYLIDTKATKRWNYAGLACHILALISAGCSLGVFLAGMASVRAAILVPPAG